MFSHPRLALYPWSSRRAYHCGSVFGARKVVMRNLKIKLGIGKMWVRPVANLAQPTPLRWGRGMAGFPFGDTIWVTPNIRAPTSYFGIHGRPRPAKCFSPSINQWINSSDLCMPAMDSDDNHDLRREEFAFDGFLIDLDGTLIDSTEAVVQHWAE